MATVVVTGVAAIPRPMSAERAFLGVSALLFTACTAATIAWCGSMSAMGGMPMPGGWTMSMTWMRMPGQTWPGAAASFLAMWIVMSVAMMLPALLPPLRRYREAFGPTSEARLGWLTALVGAGYFTVWTAVGVAAYTLGAALAALAMRQPAVSGVVPAAIGAIVLIAGALQLTGWKARQLACCGRASGHGRELRRDVTGAWRAGLQLGVQCVRCCGNLMVILLAVGVMDLAAMAAVATAITVERVAPAGQRVARAIGYVAVLAGVRLLALAAGLG